MLMIGLYFVLWSLLQSDLIAWGLSKSTCNYSSTFRFSPKDFGWKGPTAMGSLNFDPTLPSKHFSLETFEMKIPDEYSIYKSLHNSVLKQQGCGVFILVKSYTFFCESELKVINNKFRGCLQ